MLNTPSCQSITIHYFRDKKNDTYITNMFIDTHSHIYAEEFDNDREEVIQRALAANVRQIVLPDIDNTTRQAMLSLAQATRT